MSNTANKIKYGLKNVYYAIATIDKEDNSATFGTPVAIPGAVNLSLEAQGDKSPFYADDIEFYVDYANNGYDGTLEIARIPESFLKDVLGEIETSEGVLVEETSPTIVHFALMFEFKGDQRKIRHVVYNNTVSRPNVEGETKQDTVTPKTDTLNLSARPIYNAYLQKDIVKAKTATDTDDTRYSGWFNSVFQPTASTESE